jgi:hypothetical protein
VGHPACVHTELPSRALGGCGPPTTVDGATQQVAGGGRLQRVHQVHSQHVVGHLPATPKADLRGGWDPPPRHLPPPQTHADRRPQRTIQLAPCQQLGATEIARHRPRNYHGSNLGDYDGLRIAVHSLRLLAMSRFSHAVVLITPPISELEYSKSTWYGDLRYLFARQASAAGCFLWQAFCWSCQLYFNLACGIQSRRQRVGIDR